MTRDSPVGESVSFSSSRHGSFVSQTPSLSRSSKTLAVTHPPAITVSANDREVEGPIVTRKLSGLVSTL